jgi:hypothetical protein
MKQINLFCEQNAELLDVDVSIYGRDSNHYDLKCSAISETTISWIKEQMTNWRQNSEHHL